jgi:hypothetical protein
LIYTGIPAYKAIASPDAVDADQVIFAIATTSNRVLHQDFMPKRWLKNSKSMLLLVLPESDRDAGQLQRHLAGPEFKIRCLVLRVAAEDEQDRKFNILGSLMEFAAYKEGSAEYYTIIDDDVFIPSLPAFLNSLSIVNPTESHMLADETITSSKRSSTPIIITKGLLTRASAGTKWDECVKKAASIRHADKKLAKCIQHVQNPDASSPKIDFIKDFLLEETIGEPTDILESGVAPITFRAVFQFGGLPINEDAFADVILGKLPGYSAESALVRVALDGGKMIYTHGFSIVHYLQGENQEGGEIERFYISKAVANSQELSHGTTVNWLSILYTTSKGKQIEVDWILNGNNLDTAHSK